MAKRYASVTDVLHSMDIPDEQKKRQADYIKARQLSRLLTVMRSQKKMSQIQAAEKLGWSQGRVSKLETKADRDVSVGDLLDYSNALDLEMSIVFLPRGMKIVDRIKIHALEMVKLLQRLVKLSKGDGEMEQAVHRLHDECLNNLINLVGDSQKSMCIKPRKELTVIGPSQVGQMIDEENADLAHA
jgi:transcriptional regulator with XRE-family HTH domain